MMTLAISWPMIILLPCAFVIVRSLYRWFTNPARDVPGPLLAKFTRFWLLLQVRTGRFERITVALHKKYGPVVQLAPGWYSFDSPSAVTQMSKGFTKSDWYYAFTDTTPGHWDLFTEQNEKQHSINRRKLSPAYSMTALVQYEPLVATTVELLKQKLGGLADSGQKFDLSQWMRCFSFDVIGQITVGKRFGFLDDGQDIRGIMSSIHSYFAYAPAAGYYSEFHNFVFKVMLILAKLSGPESSGHMYILHWAERLIRERLADTDHKVEGPPDLLSKCITWQKEKPDSFTERHTFVGCTQNIAAGGDTTGIALTGILLHLTANKEKLSKLREEIREKNPRTFQDAQKMPYLQAVIKEALRINPPGGGIGWRAVPEGGAVMEGRFFPKGSNVGINAWVAHYNKTVFGDDVDVFRPERWLEASPHQLRAMEHYDMSFGMGTRTCIGKNIVLLELAMVVPMLVKEFDFEIVNADQPIKRKNITFVIYEGLDCYAHRRQKDSA